MSEIVAHPPQVREGQDEERAKRRSEGAIVIQRRLLEQYLDTHLAGAGTSEDERNALALTWIGRHAKDFRERVMRDPEILRYIDEKRLDDAVRRSAQLLYPEAATERPAA